MYAESWGFFYSQTSLWAPFMHKPCESQDFLQLSDVLSEQQAELLSNITYAQSSLSNAGVTDLHSIHFLWPSFSVVFKNNNPFIFIPLMPSVNYCPRHMWAISSSIQSFKHWWSMFAGKGFKNLLYVGVSLRWHRYLSWALCWWSIVKELSNCTRSWKNDFIFLLIKMGMISNILLIIC